MDRFFDDFLKSVGGAEALSRMTPEDLIHKLSASLTQLSSAVPWWSERLEAWLIEYVTKMSEEMKNTADAAHNHQQIVARFTMDFISEILRQTTEATDMARGKNG